LDGNHQTMLTPTCIIYAMLKTEFDWGGGLGIITKEKSAALLLRSFNGACPRIHSWKFQAIRPVEREDILLVLFLFWSCVTQSQVNYVKGYFICQKESLNRALFYGTREKIISFWGCDLSIWDTWQENVVNISAMHPQILCWFFDEQTCTLLDSLL